MANRTVILSEDIDLYRQGGMSYEEAREKTHAAIGEHHPVDLGIVNSVTYDTKTDRYVAKFGYTTTNTAKVTTEVAEYLLTHAFKHTAKPTVRAHMTDGTINSVVLVFLSR